MERLALVGGLFVLLLSNPSSAVNITLSGPTSGAVVAGVGEEDGTGLSQITFTVAIDPSDAIIGYDLTVAWDALELGLVSAAQLYTNAGPNFVESPVGGTSTGTPVSALAISEASATSLFSMTFDVLSLVSDGVADVRVWLDEAENGDGLSGLNPPLPTVDNLDKMMGEDVSIGIDLVPEPSTALLLGAGLVALAGRRRG